MEKDSVSKSNPELSDKQKKRSGKKKKKSRKLDADSHVNVTIWEHQLQISENSDSLPTSSSSNASGRSKEKKQEDSCCDVVEKTTTQDSSAATIMTCSPKRKRKKVRNRNTLKEGDVDIHSTIAEFATTCNTLSEAQGSKSTSIEETVTQAKKSNKERTKTVEFCDPMQSEPVECMEHNDLNSAPQVMSEREDSATGFHNLGKTKNKEIDGNTQVKEDVVAEIARSKKHKKKRSPADHKTADMEVCYLSTSTLLAAVESGSVECLLDHSNKQDVEIRDGNAGQYFAGQASSSKSEISATREENVLTDNDSLITSQIGKADKRTPSEGKKVGGNEKSTWEDQVHLSESSLVTLSAESCRRVSVSCEDQVLPSKNPLLNSMIQHTQESCKNPAATNMACSQKKKRKKDRNRNTLKKGDVDIHCSIAEIAAKYNAISEAEGSKSMSIEETVSQTQAKRSKKERTKTVELCNPLAAPMQSEPIECMEYNDLNSAPQVISEREDSATGFPNLGKPKKQETDENNQVNEEVVAEIARSKKHKKKRSPADHKTADMEVCYPSTSTQAEEKKVGGNEKSTWEDQVHLSESSLFTLSAESCRRVSVSCEDQVIPPKNPLLNSMIQEGSGQHTQESCENPAATNMACSQKRKQKKERNRNTLKEGDVDIHCSIAEIAAKYNAISEAEGSKSMSIEETVSQTQKSKTKKRKKKKTKTIEVCDSLRSTLATCMQSEPVECVENNDLNAGQELMSDLASKSGNSATEEGSGFQNLGKTKKKETDENTEVDEDVLGAGVCDIRRKKQKRKKKRMSFADHKTADMEACGPSGSTLLTTAESGSVECLLDHSRRKAMDICDGNARQEFVGEATTSKSENSAAREKSELQNPTKGKEKTKIGDTVSNKDALGPEGVSMVEVKTKKKRKKRKNSLDKKIDNMEEGEENDVSIPRKDEEPNVERVEPEKYLSSSVLIHDNVSQEVASPETRLPPRCSCGGQSTRKLVVLDLNGILGDVVQGNTGHFVPDGNVSYRKIFRRPFVASFLEFCFERFDVGIWSSRRVGLDYMINVVMRNHARDLLFCFDQHICTVTGFSAQENSTKPLFLKDLRRVWDRYETCFSCEKRKYDETNTLLIDDSPHKALCNPPYTGIFPWPYQYTDREDSALGPEGDLRKYLARLADVENVQKFVEENPFGQTAITEAHDSWEYYSKVIETLKLNH